MSPAPLGFSFPPSLSLFVIVGWTPLVTHAGLGFLVPAVSPSSATSSSPGPADLAPHHLGKQRGSPPAWGRSKEEGAGTLRASDASHTFLPLWFCSFFSYCQGIPFLQVLFMPPGVAPLESPTWCPTVVTPTSTQQHQSIQSSLKSLPSVDRDRGML